MARDAHHALRDAPAAKAGADAVRVPEAEPGVAQARRTGRGVTVLAPVVPAAGAAESSADAARHSGRAEPAEASNAQTINGGCAGG